jgi:DNA-binding NtrC family response regulator
MTQLSLHADTPDKAVVLIAGCNRELAELLSAEILDGGHRAFCWAPGSPPPESVSREEWHVCVCGPGLAASDRELIERVRSEFTRVIEVGRSGTTPPFDGTCEPAGEDLSAREWSYLLRSAIDRGLAAEQISEWQHRLENAMFRSLVTRSEPMQALCRALFSLSGSDGPLVFDAEPGIDSRGVAWCIHESSARNRSSFLSIDCAGFSSEAFESQLFQEVSPRESSGLLEHLDGGTLHLKNTQTLSRQTQKKLIRFLESPALPRGDSFSLRYINLRWIASYDRAETTVGEQPLRQYLQNRSDTRCFDLPPLRDRREDIPELARKILDEISVRLGILTPPLTDDAWRLLTEFDWPGNESQLQRVLSQAIELSDGSALTAELLSVWLARTEDHESPGNGLSLAEMERQLIESTFARFGGNRERTAQSLGIGLRTLSGKLRQYGYPPRGGPHSNKERSRISHDSSAQRAA